MKLVRRSAVVDSTPQEGNLVRVQKPKFLSLVDLPANQTGFKVVRSDSEKGEPIVKPTIKRTRRSETNPVMQLTFPAGSTAETVAATLEEFGMTSYKVQEVDGVFLALRSDLQSIANLPVTTIKLTGEGIMATVSRADTMPNPMDCISIAAIEFDSAKFDEAKITEWLTRNSVDSTISADENSDQTYVVRRSAVPAEVESRRMTLEDGVTAVIVRSDVADIPDGFVAVVNETAYGNWGWGQLDFNAAMADTEFSEMIREGMYKLEDVLRNILLWSPLPLDARKNLANNALSQFGVFVSNLMDSLPRQLLVSVVRSAQPQLEKTMKNDAASGANTQPADQTSAAGTGDNTPLTRADAEAIARAAAEATVAAMTKAAAPATETAPAAAAPAASTEQPLTRADLKSVVDEALKGVDDRLKAIEGTTVLRSDSGDAAQETVAAAAASGKDGKAKNVFRGVFGGFRPNAAAAQ